MCKSNKAHKYVRYQDSKGHVVLENKLFYKGILVNLSDVYNKFWHQQEVDGVQGQGDVVPLMEGGGEDFHQEGHSFHHRVILAGIMVLPIWGKIHISMEILAMVSSGHFQLWLVLPLYARH